MSRFALLLTFAFLLVFASCTKKKSTKACFTFSNESPKVNDTLYLLNCSEGYSKFVWVNTNGFYPSGATIDSLSRHQKVVVTTSGLYKVTLRVGEHSGFYSTALGGSTDLEKIITVNP